jgi:hypothetical protein
MACVSMAEFVKRMDLSYSFLNGGIRVKRDRWASVMYAEELNSTTSSVTLERTDRHDILGQKSSDFQLSLCARHAECAPNCPQDRLF